MQNSQQPETTASADRTKPITLSGARVFDVRGGRFTEPLTVVLRGDRIEHVGPAKDLRPGGATEPNSTIDLTGKYLLPGLIDSHFHLVSRSAAKADEDLIAMSMIEGVVNAQERIQAGVTTVRDAGCRHHGIHQLVEAVESGLVIGPRIFAAGTNPAGMAAPGHWRNVFVDGADALRAAVRAELSAGARWVKLILSHADDPADWLEPTVFFTEEELRAAVDEARKAGVRTGVHCEGYGPAKMAVACGIDALDHAPQIDAETVDMMAERGTAYVPTLWAFTTDSGVDFQHMPRAAADSVRRAHDEHRASVERALRGGVMIAAGTDAAGSLPARDVLVQEIHALMNAGLSAVDALVAATLNGAKLLDQSDDLGSVEVGKAADLLVVDANALDHPETLALPLMVISRGTIVVDEMSAHGPRAVPSSRAIDRTMTEAVTARWSAS